MSKRKRSSYEHKTDTKVIRDITLYDSLNPLIYSIDNEFHFKTEVNILNIELLIRQMSEFISKYYTKHSSDSELIVKYVVDTGGGMLNQALKFIDFVNLVRHKYPSVKFHSIITGMVASAGTLMCVIADRRFMTKNASAMIHELSAGYQGKYTHLASYSDHLKSQHEKIVKIYQDHNDKLTKVKLESLLKDETWFVVSKYLEFGFIDEIC